MGQNSPFVERKDSHEQLRGADLDVYKRHMTDMFGNTKLPAVQYKGKFVPERQLSEESFLTR